MFHQLLDLCRKRTSSKSRNAMLQSIPWTEVDPLDHESRTPPVLRWLGGEIAAYAYRQEATFFFEPWLKHDGAVFVQDEHGLEEVYSLPSSMFLEQRNLVKEICEIDTSAQPVRRSGTGRLAVCGHAFSLRAECVPSPWGERLVLRAKPEGGPISDPASAFPWITSFGFPTLSFGDCDIDIDWVKLWKQQQWEEGWGRLIARARERCEDHGRWLLRWLKARPVPRGSRRLELLDSGCFEGRHEVRRLLFNELRAALSVGRCRQLRIVVSDNVAKVFVPIPVTAQSVSITAWRTYVSGSPVARGASQIRRVIADLAGRYPLPGAGRAGTDGIACAAGGHPVDVTIEEAPGDAVAWPALPGHLEDQFKENGSPNETVFVIAIHEESPDPPHWERNRRLRMEQAARGEEDPPSSSSSSVFLLAQSTSEQPSPRTWRGWLRGRVGRMGRAQAGNMTLEDAREVASLLKAKHYGKALAQAIPFKSGGPEAVMGIVPSCLVGLLELLLGRTREARASICDYQMHAGEDLVAMLLLAECCERLGDTGGEQQAMLRALELSSKPVARLVANGELLEDHGFMKQAEFLYELSLEKEATEKYDQMAQENERKYRSCERRAHQRRLAWRYAQIAADHAVAADGIDTYLMPTEYGFAHEEKTREHGGLYWQDVEQPDGRRIRQYFPNYLNRFADNFRADPTAVRKLGPLLKQMGRADEATVFLFEALLGL